MKRQTRRAAAPRPLLLAELTVFSWEAMARRASMMMQGTCTATEYQRMMLEKMRAAQLSAGRYYSIKASAPRWHLGIGRQEPTSAGSASRVISEDTLGQTEWIEPRGAGPHTDASTVLN